jgi:hypothetical protein
MPNNYVFYSSELASIKSILNEIPEDNVMERMGFENRLRELETKIAGITAQEKKQNLKFCLTFRGEPVFDSYGILANFGGKALDAFIELTHLTIASIQGKLTKTGPIPDRHKNPILLVGPARGSFGFELEAPADNDPQMSLFDEDSDTEKGLRIIINLLEQSINGTDDEVAELVGELHTRVLQNISDFLALNLQNNAFCCIDMDKNHRFKFNNKEEVSLSLNRLSQKNIIENEVVFIGEFQGILPEGRSFEFVVDGEDIIKGKIRLSPEEISILSRENLYKSLQATFDSVTVGNSKPRYTLSKFPQT